MVTRVVSRLKLDWPQEQENQTQIFIYLSLVFYLTHGINLIPLESLCPQRQLINLYCRLEDGLIRRAWTLTSGCCPSSYLKSLGLNAKKSVLSPAQRTAYLGVVWDSITIRAQLSPVPSVFFCVV